jgi:hypothetical protein
VDAGELQRVVQNAFKSLQLVSGGAVLPESSPLPELSPEPEPGVHEPRTSVLF